METDHHFAVDLEWTGDRGEGTSSYRGYSRANTATVAGKPELLGSAARVFHGDADRWNPEELLVAALSECHLLSYLHVAVKHGIVVTGYTDAATGTMRQEGDGGRFTSVTLRPRVTISAGDPELATALHGEASALCFIASSVNFPVRHEPETLVV
ncbi:OsmC family protein [Galbitalea sp. SE-J8]|uniref:OsmC family protein n=1 Tax=Galbitalea sp. SE-J8 TaxID=3054952 RepID=UPI00259CE438|nr:OsmC family protein [Galbitalea sp. SE-J8]MDM4763489.1 OsmC family protein [Galbitalea sp. SE-J8]